MIWENFKMALISLKSAKLRSFLTMLGIIIGISSVVAINSIGEGVKKQVSGQISDLGSNVITVTSGQVISTDDQGRRSGPNPAASFGSSTLSQKDLDAIEGVDKVTNVAPLMFVSGLAAKDQTTAESAFLIATTPSLNEITRRDVTSGRFLNDGDNNQNIVVLGANPKTKLFAGNDAINQEITVRGVKFKVVGVMKQEDTQTSALSGGGFDDIIYLPLGSATELAGGNLQILRILAQTDQPGEVKPAIEDIKKVLLANHGGQEDFSVLTQEDLIGTVSDVLGLLATFIAAIASIALIVGGVGIMNIMLVSVTERTREIGIRKALGATRRMILTQFLIEAITISLLGGLLGMLAAWGQGLLVGRLAKITPVFTPNVIITAVGVSVGIGIIFGLAPAIKAARKRPIEALRYE